MNAVSVDLLVRPSVRLASRQISSFHLLGATGFASGIGLAAALAGPVGLDPVVVLTMGGLAIATFLGLAMWTKITTGDESLTFYHHAIAVTAVLVGYLVVTARPLVAYLDLAMIGFGAFLFWGRLGCLAVGCCHGRPGPWGIEYTAPHRDEGLPWYLVGVPLVPVQAFEALWSLVVVLGGGLVLLALGSPGDVLGWAIATYAVGRFGLEFFRGDADRRWRGGFSEAQWTSLGLTLGVLGTGVVGALPLGPWLPAAVLAVAGGMALVTWRRRGTSLHLLLRPDHVHQVAEMAEAAHRAHLADPSAPIAIGQTALGVQISAGHVPTDVGLGHLYSLSGTIEPLRHHEAAAIGQLLLRLRHPKGATARLLDGESGVHHVLVLEV